MTAGLEVWDASGNLQIATSTLTARVLGMTSTGTANGSLSVPDFSQGTPWCTVLIPTTRTGTCFPDITISGTTLNWSFSSGSALAVSILYGVH